MKFRVQFRLLLDYFLHAIVLFFQNFTSTLFGNWNVLSFIQLSLPQGYSEWSVLRQELRWDWTECRWWLRLCRNVLVSLLAFRLLGGRRG